MYVGQSNDIDRRWREHASGKTWRGSLCNAIAKHGWISFDAKILEICSLTDLNVAEQKWIAQLGTLHPVGFNMTTGGGQCEMTDTTRARMSASKLGVPKSDEWKAKMSARQSMPDNLARIAAMARNQTAETRAKISAANSGRVRSSEVRAQISATKKAQNAALRAAGIVRKPVEYTSEIRARMSASAKARCAKQAADPNHEWAFSKQRTPA